MENINLYQDISNRTDGDIYVGVVGPVRTGKSTFIKKFMDLLVIPNIDNDYKKERGGGLCHNSRIQSRRLTCSFRLKQ